MEGISTEGMCESQLDLYWRASCQDLIKGKRVLIFSKTTCPFCTKVKDLFDSLGVEYFAMEVDTAENGDRYKTAVHQYTGKTSVPQVFIKGKHIGGCDDTMKAHNNGELKKLLEL